MGQSVGLPEGFKVVRMPEPSAGLPPGFKVVHRPEEPAKQESSTLDTAMRYSGIPALIELAKGAGKGLMSTAAGASRLLGTPGQSISLPGLAGAKAAIPTKEQADTVTKPSNAVQSAGKGAEQVAEFVGGGELLAPLKALGKTPLAKALIGSGADAASAAGVTSVQQGTVDNAPKAAATAGVLSAAIPAALKLAGKGAIKIENVLIKPTKLDIEDGFKPESVFKYDLGGTLEQTLEKTQEKIGNLAYIAKSLRAQNPNVRVNLKLALADAGRELQAVAPRNQGGNQRILNALKNELEELEILVQNGQLGASGDATVDIAHEVLQGVGERGAWAYGFKDADAVASEKVANAFYASIRKQIEKSIPQGSVLHQVNQSIGELIPIKQAIIRRIPVEARNQAFHLSDVVSVASGNIPLAVANRAMRSGTAAKGLDKASKLPASQLPRILTGATQQ